MASELCTNSIIIKNEPVGISDKFTLFNVNRSIEKLFFKEGVLGMRNANNRSLLNVNED